MNVISRLAIAALICLVASPALQAQNDLEGNPLEEVVHEMKVAGDHLAKKVTDKATQKPQDDAISKIDGLIAELEKQKSQLGDGAGPNPSRPATDSTIRNGPGGMGDLHGARMQGDRWGELPAHERDRILQSLTEGFPPHYQAVLEAYYKRLAVEKRAEEPEAVPASKDAKSDAKPAPAAAMKQTPPVKKAAK